MAAIMGRTEVGIKKFGEATTVANNPKAKLMYYLDCICTVLDLSDTANLSRLRNYQQYTSLTGAETDALVGLCVLLSPDELCGKVIFQNADMCGDLSNVFYEISAVQHNLVVSDSIIIGGQRRAVSNIMVLIHEWIVIYWIDPMKDFALRLARIAAAGRSAGGNAGRSAGRKVRRSAGGNAGRSAGGHTGRSAGGNARRSTGGNAGRSAGGNARVNAGGSAGGNAGRSAGGNAGRSAGSNAGRSAGGNAGRNAGGNVGRSAGGNAGKSTGGNAGRSAGGNAVRSTGGNARRTTPVRAVENRTPIQPKHRSCVSTCCCTIL